MIKEKAKKKKRKGITLKEELTGYIKTAGISFLAAATFTILLSYHARSQMIKDLYSSKSEKSKLEQKIAQQIVSHSDLTATLHDKNYAVMMQVGNLYETAGELQKAEYAYHLATQKAPNGKYLSFQKLAIVLISQNKTEDAEKIINSIDDINNLSLIRFKTRANIVLGDKYFSLGKFLKAADAYENANYYYSKLKKQDKTVKESIRKRMVNAYVEAAAIIVKNGYNSDAARFLQKALKYDPNNLNIQYRLAIVYSDLNPIKAIEYFEPLISKIPQEIDRDIFNNTLMKAANIMDIEGNGIRAKYYRYKVHTLDVYTRNKVVYKDDIDVILNSFNIKKFLFTYKLNSTYTIKNISSVDINKLSAEFVLRQNDEQKELLTVSCATKRKPLYSNGGECKDINIKFGKNIFTKHELKNYYIDIYLYKEPKYKTLVGSFKVPLKSIYSSNTLVSPHL